MIYINVSLFLMVLVTILELAMKRRKIQRIKVFCESFLVNVQPDVDFDAGRYSAYQGILRIIEDK